MAGMTLEAARLLIDRAIAGAKQDFKRPVCVSVCDPQLTALPGGSVLRDGAGTVVGGIGVSGLTSAEDRALTDRLAEFVRAGQPA